MARHRTAGADRGAGRGQLIDATAIHSQHILLRAQFDKREALAPTSPSRRPESGILRAETWRAISAGKPTRFPGRFNPRRADRGALDRVSHVLLGRRVLFANGALAMLRSAARGTERDGSAEFGSSLNRLLQSQVAPLLGP